MSFEDEGLADRFVDLLREVVARDEAHVLA
jgi:hypothetical protein